MSERVARPGLRLGVFSVVAVAAGVLALGARPAGAVTGAAGPIAVSVSPVVHLSDGQLVNIDARAPQGKVIYEIRAHLCLPGAAVRNGFDFGFQGKRCANVAVGHGDIEQSAQYASGVTDASLDTFHVGEGTARWVDDLGYPGTITCGPGHPCDLVVRLEITNDAVFFTVPLCYTDNCPPTIVGDSASAPSPTTSIPKAGGRSVTSVPGRDVTGPHKGSASGTVVAGGQGSGAGETIGNASARARGSESSSSSSGGLVWLAALAGLIAGAWITSVLLRRQGWVAFAIAATRRRSASRMRV